MLVLTAIEPLVPACNVRVPVAVILPETVILPVLAAVLVTLKLAPVDVPLIVTALESFA